jgi:outer membrane lipoprotein-sorting protein
MSIFLDHPRARWAVPGAVLACIAAGGLVTNQVASADPSLPPRTAAQLLVDVQKAQLSGLSGTVVQTSNLGLPDLPGMGGSGPGGGSSSLTSMISGTHTWRVWYAGAHQARVALLGSLGESDVIRNGRDVWVWSSRDKTATHTVLAQGGAPEAAKPTELPVSPQAAADQALAALDPSTSVTTSATTSVAGRDAYELVLSPKSTTTLVKQVRIAVDATEHIPLRVQVYSTKSANPAFDVSFSQVDFAKPDASRFTFNPPPGTKVTASAAPKTPTGTPATKPGEKPAGAKNGFKTVGTGWSTVLVGTVPQQVGSGTDRSSRQLMAVLQALPRVSGAWGSGRLLNGTLFSVVLTDDGRMAVGAVPASQLYAALLAR